MKYRYIIISLFLVISIGLSNQSNEQTIEQNEIECFYGTKEEFYLINNSKNHKFLIFIKSKNIVHYNLYKGDKQNKIPSYNELSNDIYYYIKDESFLYLNILAYTYECFSFQFSETPYLDLKEKQNFTHPIIDFGTIINFPIANTYQKKITLYLYNIYSATKINFGSKRYELSSSINLIKTHYEQNENNLNISIQIEVGRSNILPIIKYEIVPIDDDKNNKESEEKKESKESEENKENKDNIEKKGNDNDDDNFNVGLFLLFIIPLSAGLICPIALICINSCLKMYKENKKEMEIKAELLGLEERKKRASELYRSIKKNYYLLEKICFICVNDEISSLFCEEENKNKTIDFIIDINNENFTSLLEYITPKECPHYFHDNCLKEKHLFYTKKNKNLCLFCKSYITAENMAKFGCITEDNLIEIVEAYNTNGKEDDHLHYSWRKTYKYYENSNFYDQIYDIFYSEVENNLYIRQIKRQKLIRIKKIKNKFKDNFDVLRFGEKKYDNYRQYDVSIYEDLDEIEEKLNKEIREKKEKLRKRNERLRIEEREERKREYLSVLCKLKTCSKCKNKCYYCNAEIEKSFSKFGFVAHRGCLNFGDRCCICKNSLNNWDLKICEYCCNNHNIKNTQNCIICKRY